MQSVLSPISPMHVQLQHPAPSSVHTPGPDDETGGGILRWATHQSNQPASSEELGRMHHEQHMLEEVINSLREKHRVALHEQSCLNQLVVADFQSSERSRFEALRQHQADSTLRIDMQTKEYEARMQYLQNQLQAQSEFHVENHAKVENHYQALAEDYKRVTEEARLIEKDQLEAKAAVHAAKQIAHARSAAKQEVKDKEASHRSEVSSLHTKFASDEKALQERARIAHEQAVMSEQREADVVSQAQHHVQQLTSQAEMAIKERDDLVLDMRIQSLDNQVVQQPQTQPSGSSITPYDIQVAASVSQLHSKLEETQQLMRVVAQDNEGLHGRRAAEDQSRMRKLEKQLEKEKEKRQTLEQENLALQQRSSSPQLYDLTPGATGSVTPRPTSPTICQPCEDSAHKQPSEAEADDNGNDEGDWSDYDWEWEEEGSDEEKQSNNDECQSCTSEPEADQSETEQTKTSSQTKSSRPSKKSIFVVSPDAGSLPVPSITSIPTEPTESTPEAPPPSSRLDEILGLKKQKVPEVPTTGVFAVPGLKSSEQYRNQEIDLLEKERITKYERLRQKVEFNFNLMSKKDMLDPSKQLLKNSEKHWQFGTFPTALTRTTWLASTVTTFQTGIRNHEWAESLVRLVEVTASWRELRLDLAFTLSLLFEYLHLYFSIET